MLCFMELGSGFGVGVCIRFIRRVFGIVLFFILGFRFVGLGVFDNLYF